MPAVRTAYLSTCPSRLVGGAAGILASSYIFTAGIGKRGNGRCPLLLESRSLGGKFEVRTQRSIWLIVKESGPSGTCIPRLILRRRVCKKSTLHPRIRRDRLRPDLRVSGIWDQPTARHRSSFRTESDCRLRIRPKAPTSSAAHHRTGSHPH